jgi:hypothetical protein
MEKINRHNYEIFFIDFFDGNLSLDQTEELYQFLNDNPGLNEEFENFENISVGVGKESFPFKENLKKKSDEIINDSNFEEFCIAFHEKDLTEEENSSLLQYAENNNKQKELDFYNTLKLETSKEIYAEKDGLKKLLIDNNSLINDNSIEEYAIAYNEGDLNKEKKTEVEKFVSSKNIYKNLLDEYKKVILIPEKIIYQQKASLKKFSVLTFSKRVMPLASAAAILLFFVFFFNTNSLDNPNLSSVTNYEKKTVVKEGTKQIPDIEENVVKPEKKETEKNIEKENKTKEKIINKEYITPARKTQNITPIKKNSPITSFKGTIQIASIKDEKMPVDDVYLIKDEEFESYLAQSNQKKNEEYLKLNELIADRMKKDILKTEDEKFSIWHIAQAGARGLSKITGKNYSVETQVDENGNTALLAINTENFEYSRAKK